MSVVARASIAALGAALILSTRVARACAVCMSGTEDESRLAFIVTTVFLSALPPLMVGGFAWWLRQRTRELERQPAVGRASSSP